MALARIPDPNQQLRASMPKAPSAGRAGVQTPPAVRSTVNRIQPLTAPKAANTAPAGRPPNLGNRFEAMARSGGYGGIRPAAPAGPAGGTGGTPPAPTPPAAPAGNPDAPAPAQATSTATSTSTKLSPAGNAGVTPVEMGKLRGGILGALNTGLEGLYNDRAFTDAIGGIKSDVEAGTAGQLAAADADAARRGLFRSGMAGARAAAIQRGGAADFSRQANDMRKAMTEANMNTRMQAAGQATDFLRGEEQKRMQEQQMRQAAAAAARANAPIPLFNEQTGQMEYLDPRVLQFMGAF